VSDNFITPSKWGCNIKGDTTQKVVETMLNEIFKIIFVHAEKH